MYNDDSIFNRDNSVKYIDILLLGFYPLTLVEVCVIIMTQCVKYLPYYSGGV